LHFGISGTFLNSNWPEIFRGLIFYHGNLLEHKKLTREAMRVKQYLVARA
jgi:hypothetical protein